MFSVCGRYEAIGRPTSEDDGAAGSRGVVVGEHPGDHVLGQGRRVDLRGAEQGVAEDPLHGHVTGSADRHKLPLPVRLGTVHDPPWRCGDRR